MVVFFVATGAKGLGSHRTDAEEVKRGRVCLKVSAGWALLESGGEGDALQKTNCTLLTTQPALAIHLLRICPGGLSVTPQLPLSTDFKADK